MFTDTPSDIEQRIMGAAVTVATLAPVALGCVTAIRGWSIVPFNASIAVAVITWVWIFTRWGVEAINRTIRAEVVRREKKILTAVNTGFRDAREARITTQADRIGADLDAADRRGHIRAVER